MAKGAVVGISRIDIEPGYGTRGGAERKPGGKVSSPAAGMALMNAAGETVLRNSENTVKAIKLVVFGRQPGMVGVFEDVVKRQDSGDHGARGNRGPIADVLGSECMVNGAAGNSAKSRNSRPCSWGISHARPAVGEAAFVVTCQEPAANAAYLYDRGGEQ